MGRFTGPKLRRKEGVDEGCARLYDEFVFSPADGELVTIAKGRFGVASWVEARACGLSDVQILNRIRAGLLDEEAVGALIVGAAPKSWEQEVALAVLSMGDQAAASHMTAAALFGMLNTSGGRVDVVVSRWDRKHRAFTVHESRDLIDADMMIHRGVRVTVPARIVVDVGAVYPAAVPEVFHRGRRLGLLDAREVEALVRRVAPDRPHRDPFDSSSRFEATTAEDIYLRISHQAGLREPTRQGS